MSYAWRVVAYVRQVIAFEPRRDVHRLLDEVLEGGERVPLVTADRVVREHHPGCAGG